MANEQLGPANDIHLLQKVFPGPRPGPLLRSGTYKNCLAKPKETSERHSGETLLALNSQAGGIRQRVEAAEVMSNILGIFMSVIGGSFLLCHERAEEEKKQHNKDCVVFFCRLIGSWDWVLDEGLASDYANVMSCARMLRLCALPLSAVTVSAGTALPACSQPV